MNENSGIQNNKQTATKTYSQQQEVVYRDKLNKLLKELPKFCLQFFNSMEYTKAPRTKVAYALDLKGFFEFLPQANPCYKNYAISDFDLEDIENLTADDIIEYLRHFKYYKKGGQEYTNSQNAIKRKLSTLRTFYNYYHKNKLIRLNPTLQVDMPKLHEHTITRLEVNEVAQLLDNVESGDKLTKEQLKKHEKLKTRDLAILSLMLGTGIRVSECVGLDLKDVDFDNDRIKIIRKGGAEAFVYFSDEVHDALKEYIDNDRQIVEPLPGHENALFISNKKQRLCVRSVENMVKKYAHTVTTVKHITPHKLRSTYGTNLYQETKDIYLVADVLGHKDVNTTRKHYAAMVDENKRRARNIVKLRSTDEEDPS